MNIKSIEIGMENSGLLDDVCSFYVFDTGKKKTTQNQHVFLFAGSQVKDATERHSILATRAKISTDGDVRDS